MKIICISGKAGHGKDYTANLLKEELEARGYSVLITHNADLLKYICKTFLGWNGEKDEEGRKLLQHIGTDVFRNYCSDYWVKFISTILSLFPNKWDFAIVPDCRFYNEIQYLKDNNSNEDVIHVRVQRENYESMLSHSAQDHESETSLDGIIPDVLVQNDGTHRYKELIPKLVDAII